MPWATKPTAISLPSLLTSSPPSSSSQEVFICGRIKDMIIVRGRNHYPQDIERHAETVAPELRGVRNPI